MTSYKQEEKLLQLEERYRLLRLASERDVRIERMAQRLRAAAFWLSAALAAWV